MCADHIEKPTKHTTYHFNCMIQLCLVVLKAIVKVQLSIKMKTKFVDIACVDKWTVWILTYLTNYY